MEEKQSSKDEKWSNIQKGVTRTIPYSSFRSYKTVYDELHRKGIYSLYFVTNALQMSYLEQWYRSGAAIFASRRLCWWVER